MTTREFKLGENMILKVNPKKISLKLGSYTKLTTRFCAPFEILDRIGSFSYMLGLPTSMNVHNLFMSLFLKNMYMILTMLLIHI
jgi:hypothetical protein